MHAGVAPRGHAAHHPGARRKDAQFYVVPNRPGRELDVEVRPASRIFVIGGIVALAVGATGIVGGVLVAKARPENNSVGASLDRSLGGGALMVIGVGAVITGIVLLARGDSPLPEVEARRHRERAERPRVQLAADAQGIGFTF